MADPLDIVYSRKNSAGNGFDEKSFTPASGSFIICDALGDLTAWNGPLTSQSSSYATLALTASYALNGGGSGSGIIIGASYPITASQALTASHAFTASYLTPENNYTVTTLRVSNSLTASKITGPDTLLISTPSSSGTRNDITIQAGDMAGGSNPGGGIYLRGGYGGPSAAGGGSIFVDAGSGSVGGGFGAVIFNSLSPLAHTVIHSSADATTAADGGVRMLGGVSIVKSVFVGGRVTATSFTGSLKGTASVAASSLLASTASYWNSSSVNSWVENNYQPKIATGSTLPITASYTITASYALNGGSSGSGGGLATGSTYPITASVAVTASYWDSSSLATLINNKQNTLVTGSAYPITASMAVSSSYSSITIVQQLNTTQSMWATQSLSAISSSWASSSLSASYWDSSSVNSWTTNNFQFKIATGSTLPITTSYWDSSSVNSWVGNNYQFKIATGSTLPITSSQSATSSWTVTASYWNSSSVNSWTTNNFQFKIATGSTLPITSSQSVTASYWDSSSVNSWVGNNYQSKIATGSTLPITSSQSITASYALNAGTSFGLATGSTYPITSSQSITSSYWDSSSVNSWVGNNYQFKIATGSTLPITSSQSITASYWDSSSIVNFFGTKQNTLVTGSAYPITASMAISSSYSSITIVQQLNTTQSIWATQSLSALSSSWASSSISASYWDSSSVNSWVGNNYQFKIATGSTLPITSSQSVTASYWNSSSINSWVGNNYQFKIATGSTLPVTSSVAITASYAMNGGSGGGLATGSTYPITASQSVTASYWDSSSVNSWVGNSFQSKIATGSTLPITSSQSVTASYWNSSSVNSWVGNNYQSKIATGSTLPITSSWTLNWDSSSVNSWVVNNYQLKIATGSTLPITASVALVSLWSTQSLFSVSASWASSSISAAYWDSSSINSWVGNNYQLRIATGSTSPVTASWAITASYALQVSNSSRIGTPEMYGAMGDGVTDDFVAIKNAFISHSVIQFDAKVYATRGEMGIPSYRTILGKGKDATVIKLIDNSPCGYSVKMSVFGSQVYTNEVGWYGATGSVVGSGSVVLAGDTGIVDESPDSPLYHLPQSADWAGLGYGYWLDGFYPMRRNIVIKDLTIDCNFSNQAKHSSYNFPGNSQSSSYSYMPLYSWKVRSTFNCIALTGENNRVENVKMVNYGYGVSFGADSTATLAPFYNEEFLILLAGASSISMLNYATNTYDSGSDGFGDSLFRGNIIDHCEVGEIGNVDLTNPYGNVSCLLAYNATTANNSDSNWSNDGGIFNCSVNPGFITRSYEGSAYGGSFLDEVLRPSMSGSAANAYTNWIVNQNANNTGSDGDYAIFATGEQVKKISGSWVLDTNHQNRFRHSVFAYGTPVLKNSVARNCYLGVYADSWHNNIQVENSTFMNVENGMSYGLSTTPLVVSYHNVIFKNNFIKLAEFPRPYFGGSGVAIGESGPGVTGNTSFYRHVDNLIIKNNIIELPVSSSRTLYSGSATPIGPYPFAGYDRYYGIVLRSETTDILAYPYTHRVVEITDNTFLYWRPFKEEIVSTGGDLYGYSKPIYTYCFTSSVYFDTSDPAAGPYPNTLRKFKREFLPRYAIESNTYCDSLYPSTSSLVPITLQIWGAEKDYCGINQVSRVSDLQAVNISATTVTGSLYGTSSFAVTASYWNSSSINSWVGNNYQLKIATGSIMPVTASQSITASFASSSLTASYFNAVSGSGAWKIYADLSSGNLVFNYA